MFTIKVQVILDGPLAQRSTGRMDPQASYTIGSGIQENQPEAQIAARRSIFTSDGVMYVANLFGAGGNLSRGTLAWVA